MSSNVNRLLLSGSDLASDHSSSMMNNQDEIDVTFIGTRLYINGFLYNKDYLDIDNNRIQWECRGCLMDGCHVKVITSIPAANKMIIYTDFQELEHNHSPDIQKVETTETATGSEQDDEHESHSHNQACSDYGSNWNIGETQIKTKPQGPVSLIERVDKMDVDDSINGTKVKQSIQSKVERAPDTNNLDHQVPVPPRIVGRKLYIAGYIYTRSYSYVSRLSFPKTYWQCQGVKRMKCKASAITTNPDIVQDLIVYKGPDQSIHKHPPSLVEMKDAEEVAKCKHRGSSFELDSNEHIASMVPVPALTSTDHVLKPSELNNVEKINDPKCMQMKRTEVRLHTSIETNNDQALHQMSIKLIGKQLFIDGYVYGIKNYRLRTKWYCQRYQKTGCKASAFTSNPSSGKELTVYKVDNLSNHNHPPNELLIEDSESQAKICKNYLVDEKLEKSNASDSQSLLQYSHKSRPKKNSENTSVTATGSNSDQPYDGRKISSVLRTRKQNKNMPRLHYDVDYRKFLVEFSKKPIFDKQILLRALKVIYISPQSRLRAYAIVMENRIKIERDLESMKNDPDTAVTALNNKFSLLDSNENSDTNQKEHRLSHEVEVAKMVHPNPSTVHVKEDLYEPTPFTTSENEPNTEQETVFIDLTNYSDDCLEMKGKVAASEEMRSPSKQMEETVDVREDPLHPVQDEELDAEQNIRSLPSDFHKHFMPGIGEFTFDSQNQVSMSVDFFCSLLNQAMDNHLNHNAENRIFNA